MSRGVREWHTVRPVARERLGPLEVRPGQAALPAPAVCVGREPEAFVEPYPVGSRVRHRTLGAGTVQGYEPRCRRIVVDFDQGGARRLALPHVTRNALLEADV